MVIRVRGLSDISGDKKQTLQMLHLNRNCHAVLIDDSPSNLGMLRKVRNYIAWGEISKENLGLLLKKRGRLVGDERLTDEYARELGYKSLEDMAEATYKLEMKYNDLPRIKPVFRLHPPKKGFKGPIKKSAAAGGVTGDRSAAINDLIERMM